MTMNASETDLLPCPCCGQRVLEELGNYEICDVCGWEDDPVQSSDPDFEGGANEQSLNQAKAEWERKST
jgi:hypothetical protein